MNAYLPSAESLPGGAFTGRRRLTGEPRWRQVLRATAREPLVHFLLIGLAILAVSRHSDARATRYAIDMTPAATARLVTAYQQQYGSLPSGDQLHTLVDDAIREEVYLREGVDLGLDRDDEIVRRRIAQKFSFLRQDAVTPPSPTDAELRAWYASHLARYRHPAKRSFDQLYFAMDRVGDDAARRKAATRARDARARAAPHPPGLETRSPGRATFGRSRRTRSSGCSAARGSGARCSPPRWRAGRGRSAPGSAGT